MISPDYYSVSRCVPEWDGIPVRVIVICVVRHALTIDLMVEAAMEGSRDKAMAMLMNDPNIFDFEAAEKCLDELIEAHIEYLPKFRK